MVPKINVAVVQLKYTTYDKTLRKALFFLNKVAKRADIAIFSEYFLGWNVPVKKTVDIFKKLAKKYKINIVLGSLLFKQKNKMFNSSFIINKTGNIAGRYDKIHLFPDWEKINSGKKPKIFDLGNMKIGLLLCLDIYFPNEFLKLRNNVDFIIVPSMTSKDEIDDHLCILKARAIENIIPIVLCNATGNMKYKNKTIIWGGDSSFVNCEGKITPLLKNEEGYKIFSIDLAKKSEKRKKLYTIFKLS